MVRWRSKGAAHHESFRLELLKSIYMDKYIYELALLHLVHWSTRLWVVTFKGLSQSWGHTPGHIQREWDGKVISSFCIEQSAYEITLWKTAV